MKKIFRAFILILLVFSISACGSTEKSNIEDVTSKYNLDFAVKKITKETKNNNTIIWNFTVQPSTNKLIVVSIEDHTSKIIDIDVLEYTSDLFTEEEIEEDSKVFIGRYLMEFGYTINTDEGHYAVMSAIHRTLEFVQRENILSNLAKIELNNDGYEIENTTENTSTEVTGEQVKAMLEDTEGTYLVYTMHQNSNSHLLRVMVNKFIPDCGKKIYVVNHQELYAATSNSKFANSDDAPLMFLIHNGAIILDIEFTKDELMTGSTKVLYNKLVPIIK
jgi:ribosomal protein L33